MVAINQFDNLAAATADAAGTAETVPVDSTKLANADAIVLKSGDSKGSPVAIQAVALQAAPAGPTVTFMNGSETFATLAAADGKVVLPDVSTNAPTVEVESGYAAKTLTFVGWVDENGADITADTAVTENVTVYAKYETDVVIGDVNGDGKILPIDRTAIHMYITTNGATARFNVGKEAYKGTGVIVGDVNGDGKILPIDRTAVHMYVNTNGATARFNVGKKVYYVNK